MANFGGLLGNMQANDMDQYPDQKKPAADLFTQLGILSPSEKRAQQVQQQITQQLLQQQQAQIAQQMRIQQQNANTQQRAAAPGGFNFSTYAAMGGLQGLPNPMTGSQRGFLGGNQSGAGGQPNIATPQSGGSPGAGFDIDPSSILSQEIQLTPDDQPGALRRAGQKLLAVANARKDGDLQKVATNILAKGQELQVQADKDKAGIRNTNATAEGTEQKTKFEAAQAGNPGTPFTYRTADGDISTARDTKNNLGGVNGMEVLGKGPNKQINGSDDLLTGTQAGEQSVKFEDLLANTDATISAMRDIRTNLANGAAQGWTATGVSFFNNVKGSLEQLAGSYSYTDDAVKALAGLKGGAFQEWANKTGVNSSIWNDLVSNLAKTYNPTGTITEKDITRAAKTVGQDISNPQTVVKVLEDAERRSRNFVDKKYKYSTKKVQMAIKDQYDTFLQTFTPGAEGEDETSDDPKVSEDDEPAKYANPKTQAEYDKLKPGQEYQHPDDPVGKLRKKK